MGFDVRQDAIGTHVDWTLQGVTAAMIDWFWCNMEKGFLLWHPEQHEPLEWVVPPRDGNPLGAIHNAPQTWNDGRRQDLFIRFERLDQLPDPVRGLITHRHVMAVAGLGVTRAELDRPDPLGYRLHQWSASDTGVVGRSSGIGARRAETAADGLVWAAHCSEEVANWAVFLPTLHALYQRVTDPRRNPTADLSVDGRGAAARYCRLSGSD